MDVRIVHHGGASDWCGRTRLNCPVTTAVASLPSNDGPGIEVVHQWLERHATWYPDNEVVPVAMDAQHDENEPRTWTPTSAPPPLLTPPFAIDLELAVGRPCPWPLLKPWWDAISVPPSGDLTSRQTGTRVAFTRCVPPGTWTWSRSPAVETASLDVVDGASLVARCTYVAAERKNKEAGFVGSFVPLYREARDLASSLSEEKHYLEVGCRLGFEHITSITLQLTNNNVAPLIGTPLKQLVAARGFGELQHSSLAVETSDGWGPMRIELAGPPGGNDTVEREQHLIAWAQWLRAAVAHHRAHHTSWLTEHLRAALQPILDGQHVDMVTTRNNKYTVRTMHLDVPGAVPISVPVSEIDPTVLQS